MGHAHRLLRAGTAVLSSVSLFASAVSSSSSITWPGGLQAGDAAFLVDYVRGSSPTIIDHTASGFTAIASATAGDGRAWRKILTGSESGSFTVASSITEGAILLIFRGNMPIASITESTFNSQYTSGDPSPQTVTAVGGAVPLVVIACTAGSSGGPAFTTASPAFDATVSNSGPTVVAGYKIYNSSPANHTVDAADVGLGNYLISGYLAFA